ncbi:hypothetical protein HY632_03370 [Candidatus Uhrbacteria bacterium]|nr:hypothetical protein [Candidatus Uhrbacteria bacterium]
MILVLVGCPTEREAKRIGRAVLHSDMLPLIGYLDLKGVSRSRIAWMREALRA